MKLLQGNIFWFHFISPLHPLSSLIIPSFIFPLSVPFVSFWWIMLHCRNLKKFAVLQGTGPPLKKLILEFWPLNWAICCLIREPAFYSNSKRWNCFSILCLKGNINAHKEKVGEKMVIMEQFKLFFMCSIFPLPQRKMYTPQKVKENFI